MPNITDPTATAFVNDRVRRLADRLVSLRLSIDTTLEVWNNSVAALFSGGVAGDDVVDGAANDGRVILERQDVQNFMAQLMKINEYFDGQYQLTPPGVVDPGVYDVIQKPHVNSFIIDP